MNLFAMYQRQKKQEMEELREIRRACFRLMRASKDYEPNLGEKTKLTLVSSNNKPTNSEKKPCGLKIYASTN